MWCVKVKNYTRKYPYTHSGFLLWTPPPHPSGNTSLASYFPLNVVPFETPPPRNFLWPFVEGQLEFFFNYLTYDLSHTVKIIKRWCKYSTKIHNIVSLTCKANITLSGASLLSFVMIMVFMMFWHLKDNFWCDITWTILKKAMWRNKLET